MSYYLIIVFSVFIASVAQMLLKKGASIKYASFIEDYLNCWVLGGYSLLGISLLLNIYSMSRGVEVHEVSSIESLSYLFVPILSRFCFKETLSFRKIGSILIILIGICVFFWQ